MIILHGDRWLTRQCDEYIIWYINVESWFCKPETNMILYANSNLKSKIEAYKLNFNIFYPIQ